MTNRRVTASRPEPVGMQTSPPASPTYEPFMASTNEAGVATPPETPSRSDSVISRHTKRASAMPVTSETTVSKKSLTKDGILEYCTNEVDYEVLRDKKLGAGRFSHVYLARSIVAAPSPPTTKPLTPPITPTSPRSRDSWSAPPPAVYAVKTAADKGSVKALRGEARILSHLSMDNSSKDHIVSFHGLDSRYNSLVFTALPATLEDFIVCGLEHLDSVSRTTKLTAELPHLTRSLTSSLAWLHSRGVVHADIKPMNILLRADIPVPMPLHDGQSMIGIPFTPVFADFTSSFLTTDDPKTISSIGGGTYDYMAPEQLSAPFPLPNFRMDVYALAVSLLQVITGSSPFKEAGTNRHMKMAMVKEGNPLAWAARDATSEARLNSVAQEMLSKNGADLKAFLELGLRKNPEDRLSADEWSRLW